MPADSDDLPSTLRRSPAKARRTWRKTHDAAVQTYGEGERAHRTAFASLKHSFEKVGDHWEPKEHRGPSDAQAARRTDRPGATGGGVDERASTAHLYQRARELGLSGRSTMSRQELLAALRKASARLTAAARR